MITCVNLHSSIDISVTLLMFISDISDLLISFIVYLGFMLTIGITYYKKTSNLNDYVLGDRSLNSWVTALSAQASDMSGWLLMGLPGYAFAAGMESIWIAIGLAVLYLRTFKIGLKTNQVF